MMKQREITVDANRAGAVAALAGMAAAAVTGAACIGPMIGIALGVGGLGWLARYAPLQLPASVTTAALLALGFHLLYRRRDRGGAARRRARALLWIAVAFAAAINAFEYLILPTLG
ncbi:MAG: hypothetical protein KDH15_03075 [Rhodocyclaceae bacterium]|nr:hypothetical protein [Rhodocyclaceae bacterium]